VFRRNISGGLTGALYLLALTRDRRPAGEPSILVPATLDGNHPSWTPDSSEIIFSARERLWRVALSGDRTPTRLPFVGEDGMMPAVSRATNGLAYVRSAVDTNIWRIETAHLGEPSESPPRVAISSTRQDGNPQLSPDGRRVAFASNRSGEVEIWVTDPDGANALQLTAMNAAATGSPRWSPDGESVAFNSNRDGHWDLYVVAASGGRPRRLTDTPSNDSAPSFSSDGRWIYFNSNRTGEFQIWKMPATGGRAVQLTHNGGYIGFESPDGAYLYYTQTLAAASPLWRVRTSGGPPERIVDGVIWRNFVVLERGVYYIEQMSGTTQLQFIDTATRRITTIARGLGDVRYGMTATADGRSVMYTRIDSVTDDVMLVEKFR
jgi:Tol biopolymer transport system component